MKIHHLLAAVALLGATLAPTLGSAQRQLHVDPDHFKVDKNKAKVKPRQAQIHPRRLAVNTKDGRHQVRVLGKKDRHTVRKNVRGVTHHVTTPHHPAKKG